MDTVNDLLTVKEVSKYLRKSPSTVYRLTRQGQLPAKKVGGTWRFSRKGIEEWVQGSLLASGSQPAQADPVAPQGSAG